MLDVLVSFVVAWEPLVRFFKFRRRNVITSSPYLHLLLPVLFHCLKFVKSLKSSIVTFVESPVLMNGNVVTVKFVGRIVEGLDSPCED